VEEDNMSKIVNVLAGTIQVVSVSIAGYGMYCLGKVGEFVDDTTRLVCCGVAIGLAILMLSGGAYGHLMRIENKIDEMEENAGGN
jgi:hypothetical protein